MGRQRAIRAAGAAQLICIARSAAAAAAEHPDKLLRQNIPALTGMLDSFPMLQLPVEIQVDILKLLGFKELKGIELTGRHFR